MKKLLFAGLIVVLLLGVILPISPVLAKHPNPNHIPEVWPPDYYLAAHAVVVNECQQEETAWADCSNSQQFNEGGSWAFYFTYPGNGGWNGWGLYAGQNTLIGWLVVDIDEVLGTVNVKWIIEEPGWKIIETHIALADSFEEIPQTKNGNPKVGQFAIGGERTGETFSPGLTFIEQNYNL